MPADADLVIIGNPTNPTGVLHPAERPAALVRPGRLLVVDEAFMDAVPGEPETLITGGSMDGRPGAAVADQDLGAGRAARRVRRRRSRRDHRAGTAAGTVVGLHARRRRHDRLRVARPPAPSRPPPPRTITRRRDHLLAGLTDLGLPGRAASPEPPSCWSIPAAGCPATTPPEPCAYALRERGFAVRRGETFPGLGADWIRIAVRDEETTDTVIKTLRAIREEA